MPVEVHAYRLRVRGVDAGRQTLRREGEGRQVRLHADTRFEGPLPTAQVTQSSHCADDGTSYSYLERTQDRSGPFETRMTFDRKTGQVVLERGRGDAAEAPYVAPFRDPLSLLHQLRRPPNDDERIRVPMVGKTVEARAVGDVELDSPFGRRTARAYRLYPGAAWVWVDHEPPHAILKLAQRIEAGRIEAELVSVATEAAFEGFDEMGGEDGKRRRRRRKRRRGREHERQPAQDHSAAAGDEGGDGEGERSGSGRQGRRKRRSRRGRGGRGRRGSGGGGGSSDDG